MAVEQRLANTMRAVWEARVYASIVAEVHGGRSLKSSIDVNDNDPNVTRRLAGP